MLYTSWNELSISQDMISQAADRAEDDRDREDTGEDPEGEDGHPALGSREEAHQLEWMYHHDIP